MTRKHNNKRKRIISITLILVAFFLMLGIGVYYAVTHLGKMDETEIEQIQSKNEADNQQETEAISEKEDFDYEALGIEKATYPESFKLSVELQDTVILLATSVDGNISEKVHEDWWQEYFISHYLKNSHYSFGYLSYLGEKNDNKLSKEQVEYLNYALTGEKISFDMKEDEFVDISDCSSFEGNWELLSHSEDEKEDEVVLHLKLKNTVLVPTEDGDVGAEATLYDYDVTLKKNPYSCFDGYSVNAVKEVNKEEVKSDDTTENSDTAKSANAEATISSQTSYNTNQGPITAEEYATFKKTCDGPQNTNIMQDINELMKKDYTGTWYDPQNSESIRLTPEGAYVYIPYLDEYGDKKYEWELIDRSARGACPQLAIYFNGRECGPLSYYVAGYGDGYFYGKSQGYVFYKQ